MTITERTLAERTLAERSLIALLVAGLAACSSPTAQHTVEDYRADSALRQAQLDRCTNDPGMLGATPDCINAREAARRAGSRSLREVPPVPLPREQKPYAIPDSGEPGSPESKD